MTKRTPSSVRSFSIMGNEWHLPKVKVPKHKDAPVFTEERRLRVWDAIDPERREEISAEAKQYAAEQMAAFEAKRGRR